jgi:hypothetical protein
MKPVKQQLSELSGWVLERLEIMLLKKKSWHCPCWSTYLDTIIYKKKLRMVQSIHVLRRVVNPATSTLEFVCSLSQKWRKDFFSYSLSLFTSALLRVPKMFVHYKKIFDCKKHYYRQVKLFLIKY